MFSSIQIAPIIPQAKPREAEELSSKRTVLPHCLPVLHYYLPLLKYDTQCRPT